VANDFGDSVTVYAAGSKRILRKISKHVVAPTALAFDSAGNLYVANAFNNTVTVYARVAPKRSGPYHKESSRHTRFVSIIPAT
jgi:DNA-binding beta-propeller fold protein YncE